LDAIHIYQRHLTYKLLQNREKSNIIAKDKRADIFL